MNRRSEYSWGKTMLADLSLIPESREYKLDEAIRINLGFRVIGGLRESFIPDVWTVAWEDNDKMVRMKMEASLRKGSGKAGHHGEGSQEGKVLLEPRPGPSIPDLDCDHPRRRERSHHPRERRGREVEVPGRRQALRDSSLQPREGLAQDSRFSGHRLGTEELP